MMNPDALNFHIMREYFQCALQDYCNGHVCEKTAMRDHESACRDSR